jgi:hypothetical protein
MIDLMTRRADQLMEVIHSIHLKRKRQAEKEKANKRFVI